MKLPASKTSRPITISSRQDTSLITSPTFLAVALFGILFFLMVVVPTVATLGLSFATSSPQTGVASNTIRFNDEHAVRIIHRGRGFDEPLVGDWALQITSEVGDLREHRLFGRDGHDLARMRAVRFHLSWKERDVILQYDGSDGREGELYVLPHHVARLEGATRSDLGEEVHALPQNLKTSLRLLGRDAQELEALSSVEISGQHEGIVSRDFVSRRPDVAVIIKPGFRTEGVVVAEGPIIVRGNRPVKGALISARWIAFTDRSSGDPYAPDIVGTGCVHDDPASSPRSWTKYSLPARFCVGCLRALEQKRRRRGGPISTSPY